MLFPGVPFAAGWCELMQEDDKVVLAGTFLLISVLDKLYSCLLVMLRHAGCMFSVPNDGC